MNSNFDTIAALYLDSTYQVYLLYVLQNSPIIHSVYANLINFI